MQIAGRVVFGAIAARLGARAITATMFVAQAVGLSMLAVVRELPGGLLPIVIVLGIANGMSTLARATTLASVFGPREYATISGALAAGANGARAVGPVGASLLYVGLGGYEAVFWTLAAALALAGLALAVTEARAPAGGTPER
jgi:predicted MFS family arabinose efflux permease